MGEVMIIAPTMREGEVYAREHGLNPRCVVTPRSTTRARGFIYDDFVIVGDVYLDEGKWAALTPCFLHAGRDVLDRWQYAALDILPPPIELERESVSRF